MSKKILIMIDEQGNILSDFMGFSGDSCKVHEQRFRQLLAEYGVQTTSRITSKTPQQIESELAEASQEVVRTWTKTKV